VAEDVSAEVVEGRDDADDDIDVVTALDGEFGISGHT
jgi:hypothetical protein